MLGQDDPSENDAAQAVPGQGVVGRGTNQMGMREANERVVLTLLRRNANMAKADIARSTGLSAQTVARLIGALEADGLILHGTPVRGRIGQPSRPLSLNPEGAVFLGLKVGRRSVEMAATDFMGTILARRKQVFDYPAYKIVLAFALRAAHELRADLAPSLQERIAGLGIAMPFFMWSWGAQIGVDPALMADWETHNLRDAVADSLDLPVFLQNDATSACSAEMVFGADPLPANTACFYIAFFMGGGLALNNALYTGTRGNAAGFGPLHVPDLQGVARPLIELASLGTLEKALQRAGHDTLQLWEDPENWRVPADILDPWVAQCANALAHAIRSTQTILDLEAVLIDGWLPRAVCTSITELVRRDLAALDMVGMHPLQVLPGTLGPDARVLGAASLPLNQRFLVQ